MLWLNISRHPSSTFEYLPWSCQNHFLFLPTYHYFCLISWVLRRLFFICWSLIRTETSCLIQLVRTSWCGTSYPGSSCHLGPYIQVGDLLEAWLLCGCLLLGMVLHWLYSLKVQHLLWSEFYSQEISNYFYRFFYRVYCLRMIHHQR